MDTPEPPSTYGRTGVPPVPPPLVVPPSVPRRKEARGWRFLAITLIIIVGFYFFGSLLVGPVPGMKQGRSGERMGEFVVENNQSVHKIAVIDIEGLITANPGGRGGVTMVDLIRDQLKRAGEDNRVKAVVLKVDSPGGEVLASDEIYNGIERFQENYRKPVIASMGSLAASGGYYVSAPCSWIVANELTITGSIGVIMHAYNLRGLMDKVGVRPQVFKSGKYKDMLSMDKREEEVTDEERAMIQNLVNETYGRFREVVEKGRSRANQNHPEGRKLSDAWVDVADGRIFSGKQAFDHGFVDEIGNFDAAVERARKLAKIDSANLIQYRQPFDLGNLFRLFGKTEAARVTVDLGGPAGINLRSGYLYFIMPGVSR